MATTKSKRSQVLCLYLVIIPLFQPCHATGRYFKMVAGTECELNEGDSQDALIRKEFFQCSREDSCTHVMKTSQNYVIVHDSDELRKRKYEAMCIYKKMQLPRENFSLTI